MIAKQDNFWKNAAKHYVCASSAAIPFFELNSLVPPTARCMIAKQDNF
jgi:hypothetical protein